MSKHRYFFQWMTVWKRFKPLGTYGNDIDKTLSVAERRCAGLP